MSVTRGVQFVLDIGGNADRKLATLATASTAYSAAVTKAIVPTAGLTKSLGGLKEATEKLQLGTLSRGLGMVQGAMASLASPASAATVAIGAVALAGLAGAAALVKLTTSAKAWHDELAKAGMAENLLTPEQVRDVERMQSAFGDLGVELKRLAVIIAADLAPSVARAVGQMVDWLNAAEGLVKRIDWTSFFSGLVLGFTNINGKLEGARILSESWLKVLTKIGILAPQVGVEFQTDPNRSKFGEMAGPLGTAIDDARAVLPSSEEKDPFKAVAIDFSEEMEEQTSEVRRLHDNGRQILDAAEAAQKMRERTLEAAQGLNDQIDSMQAAIKADRQAMLSGAMGAAAMGDAGGAATMIGNAIMPGLGTAVATGFGIALNSTSLLKDLRQGLIRMPDMLVDSIDRLFTTAIPKFIRALPRMFESLNLLRLGLAITKAIIESIPKLVGAIAQAFFQAIKEAFERVVNFFRGGEDKNILTGRREKWLGTSFKRGQFSLFGFGNAEDDPNAGETGHGKRGHGSGSRLDRMSRMTGGYIDRTDWYRLHAGERVVPPTGSSTSAAMAAMRGSKGGDGPRINVTIGTAVGMDAREVARWIRRELGDYGTGASLTARA